MNDDLSNTQPVIGVSKLGKAFGDHVVLREFSLKVMPGEQVVVLGRSGSGKSVLIKCIAGLIAADSGSIGIFGQQVADLKVQELDKVRERVGFLFQNNALYDSMSVRENLEFPLRMHRRKMTGSQLDNAVAEALSSVGLSDVIDFMPADLSGGMRKRVALARTLIMRPEVILYDEPTAGLDPVTSKEICQLMNEVAKNFRTSSIVISHDMKCVKLVSTRVAILMDGSCYATGSYNELMVSVDPLIKQFFE